jgi:hypothetical protein
MPSKNTEIELGTECELAMHARRWHYQNNTDESIDHGNLNILNPHTPIHNSDHIESNEMIPIKG